METSIEKEVNYPDKPDFPLLHPEPSGDRGNDYLSALMSRLFNLFFVADLYKKTLLLIRHVTARTKKTTLNHTDRIGYNVAGLTEFIR